MRSTDDARDRIRRRLDALTGAGPGYHDPPGTDPGADPPGLDGDGIRAPDWLRPSEEPDGMPRSRARLAPGRRGVVALVMVGVVAAGVGVFGAWRDRPSAQAVEPLSQAQSDGAQFGGSPPVGDPGTGSVAGEPAVPGGDRPAGPAVPPSTPPAPADLVVSVVGLVHASGLVHLPDGARIADAVAAAGGAREGADLLGLNMAQRVADGDQILVGVAPEGGAPVTVGSGTVGAGAGAGAGAAGGGGPGPSGTGGPAAGGKVNLNTATAEELDALPGVGPVTAASILAWRTANGRFTDVEQLGEVDGIGPARLGKLRDLVAV
ncbi:ComEA family DNA-binding protein [Rhodococcus kronopolitis]|uniref:ComEA family DNA-binding protein n=1 Tax=Rhodococcus kronopolitis TaxID=1460226 RepID=A0ABV9FMW5_9NOCA